MHMILVRHMIYGVISSSSRPASLLLALLPGSTMVLSSQCEVFFEKLVEYKTTYREFLPNANFITVIPKVA